MNFRLCLVFLTVLALVAGVNAIPPLPYEFHGSVMMNGTPSPAGTEIVAKINGTVVGNITTEKAGAYGGPATFDHRLVVNGEENQIGSYITFWIGDLQAAEKVKLWAGESQKLDLTFAPGTGGSIDASITPSQTGVVPEIPDGEPTQKSPAGLMLPAIALGAGYLLLRRK